MTWILIFQLPNLLVNAQDALKNVSNVLVRKQKKRNVSELLKIDSEKLTFAALHVLYVSGKRGAS